MERLFHFFFFSLFRKESCTCKPITYQNTTSCYSGFQGWGLMLAAYFSVLLFQMLLPPLLWEGQGTNLVLALLPLALLSGVLCVMVISSKLEVVLLPRDLSDVLYKEIVLLQAWPENPSGNTAKRAKKTWLILSLVKARTRSFPLGLLSPCYLRK